VPSLTNIDPQGELVRRITALEAEVRRVSTIRRDPSPVLQVVGGNGVALGVGANNVNLNSVSFATDGWDVALPQITFPVAGVYTITVTVPFMTGAAVFCIVGLGAASMQVATSETSQQIVSFTRAFTAGQDEHLTAFMGAARTPGTSWVLNAVRLADTPELV
jgi:hypothetical protein